MPKKTPIVLKWYQYISKFTPASCRYYPTCSEYAKWLFENANPISATAKTALRIASCNQLFPGGIDYPTFNYLPPKVTQLYNFVKREPRATLPFNFKPYNSKLRIKYWLIPNIKNYYIIKDFDATATYFPSGYAFTFAPRGDAKNCSTT